MFMILQERQRNSTITSWIHKNTLWTGLAQTHPTFVLIATRNLKNGPTSAQNVSFNIAILVGQKSDWNKGKSEILYSLYIK